MKRSTCVPRRASAAAFAARVASGMASAVVLVLRAAHAQPAPPAVVTPPVVVTHVDAVYPPASLAERAHGDVTLAVTVDADGHVSNVEVVGSGGPSLDEAATIAVRQWVFVPAMRGEVPIASRIRVPFHFAPPAPAPELVEPPTPAQPTLPSTSAVPQDAPAARANAPAEATAAPPAGQVVVVGRALPPTRGASDYHVRVGELARVPRQNATEMLKLAPGFLLTNEGGEGHAEQIFLRGFDAREGQDVEVSVGGVPVNESGNLHGNGYADTHFILPELVASLRVVEGPFDPRQGNYAVAGSAEYELGLARRGLTAKYVTGSFGTRRALVLWGPRGESVGTFGGAEIYETAGFGQNRDARRATAMTQYEGHIGEHGSYRITGAAYATSYHSAGVIRDDDYRAGRVGFYDTYDTRQGGDASRYALSGDVESRTGDATYHAQLFVIARSMRLRENFTGFLLDPQQPAQSPHGQRGDLLDLETTQTTLGSRGFARYHATAFGRGHDIELGYFARGDRTSGTQHRLEAVTGYPYRRETDVTSMLGDIGLYADASLRPTAWLTVRGGARADLLSYDVLDACAVHDVAHPSKTSPPGDASCLSQQDFGRYREPTQRASTASAAFLPRASVLLGPLADLTLSLSYGEGVRSIDPVYITQDVEAPFARVRAYEGGVAYAGGTRDVAVGVRSSFFQTHVDRDLLFNESAGRNTLASGTTRTGWVGSLRATGAFYDESASLTLVKSTFDDTRLLVPYAPNAVLRSDSALFADLPLAFDGSRVRGGLGAGLTFVGARALPYGQRSDAVFTVDASATASWRALELGLVASNVFDRRYRLGEYNYASDFHAGPAATLVPVRHFAAGAPRALFATFGVTLGGNE